MSTPKQKCQESVKRDTNGNIYIFSTKTHYENTKVSNGFTKCKNSSEIGSSWGLKKHKKCQTLQKCQESANHSQVSNSEKCQENIKSVKKSVKLWKVSRKYQKCQEKCQTLKSVKKVSKVSRKVSNSQKVSRKCQTILRKFSNSNSKSWRGYLTISHPWSEPTPAGQKLGPKLSTKNPPPSPY